MGITIFKVFVWGGILSAIRLEITFYGSARTWQSRDTKLKILIQLAPKFKDKCSFHNETNTVKHLIFAYQNLTILKDILAYLNFCGFSI